MDGDNVTITFDGESQVFKLEKDLLVADNADLGGKIYFVKDVKNFKFPDDVKDFGQ